MRRVSFLYLSRSRLETLDGYAHLETAALWTRALSLAVHPITASRIAFRRATLRVTHPQVRGLEHIAVRLSFSMGFRLLTKLRS